jgi:phosphoribosyl-ATP pyrophosphohydrolase/phosphoribosyl-AMP cyclohydrolase
VGEEGVEVALAGVSGTDQEVVAESADLIYHLLVLLRARGLPLVRVVDELQARHSGR